MKKLSSIQNRKNAIKNILKLFQQEDALFVSTDGLISRDLYALKKEGVFPMVGSMGLAPAIGLGIALNSNKTVVIINGDGSYLMSKATQDLIETMNLENIHHFILDNCGYGTTGGQKRAKYYHEKRKGLSFIRINNEGEKPLRIINLKEIKKAFMELLEK